MKNSKSIEALRMSRRVAAFVLACALSPAALPAQEAPPVQGETSESPQAASDAVLAPDTPVVETIPLAETGTAAVADDPEVRSSGDDANRIDTIEVTAGKRVKSQRDIAGSVAAFRGEILEKMGAKDLSDYLKLVPGVIQNQSSADRSVVVIRGIATSLIPGTLQGTTGIYVDEMPFADLYLPLSTPDLNPFDLERVEIMKGPQGTLFGSGAFSGAIRYITQKPNTGTWQTKLALSGNAVSQSEGKGYQAAGMLNIPLLDNTAGVRGVFLTRKEAGYTDDLNRGEKDVNRLSQNTGRLLASWNPLDGLNLGAFYFVQESHQDDFAYADQRETLTRETSNRASPRDSRVEGANLTANYEFDFAQLQSISNRLGKQSSLIQDGDRAVGEGTGSSPRPTGSSGANGPGLEDQDAAGLNTVADAEVTGWTQEFRLVSSEGSGDWEWIAGAAYLDYDQDSLVQLQTPGLSSTLDALPVNLDELGLFPIPTPLGNLTSLRSNLQAFHAEIASVATEKSLFGEATRRLGERWELTLGGRYYQTHLLSDVLYTGLVSQASTFRIEERGQREVQEKGFNPKASVRFEMNRNLQVYVLAARGFQFGGVQIDPPTLATETDPVDHSTYKSSVLWNYEIGVRTEWFDRRLKFDVVGFYMDWKDLQVSVTGTAGLFGYIDNVGKAHSKGVEVALQVNPTSGLNFTSSAAWIEASTDVDFVSATGTARKGSRLPGSPHFQIANSAGFQYPFGASGVLAGLTLTQTYSGTAKNDIFGTAEVGGYALLDARFNLLKPDSRFRPDIGFSVNNILDTRGVGAVLKAPGVRYEDVYFVKPRTLLLTLGFQY